MKRYIAKPNTWFDVGTEAILIIDGATTDDPFYKLMPDAGLFRGTHEGHEDEEHCDYKDFTIEEKIV